MGVDGGAARVNVFIYKGDPLAKPVRWGLHRYPSGIGWYLSLPSRLILAIQVRKPRSLR